MTSYAVRKSLIWGFILLISISGCHSFSIDRSLSCEDFIIVKIHSFNAERNKGLLLFNGETPEHGRLKVRHHMPKLLPITTTLRNGRIFHVLPKHAKLVQNHVGKSIVPICWHEDNHFKVARFYIRIKES